jgi:hypothetical protein
MSVEVQGAEEFAARFSIGGDLGRATIHEDDPTPLEVTEARDEQWRAELARGLLEHVAGAILGLRTKTSLEERAQAILDAALLVMGREAEVEDVRELAREFELLGAWFSGAAAQRASAKAETEKKA